MKQKVLLLMVLALGMCSINGSAQTKKPVRKTTTQKTVKQTTPKESREYQVEDDGFEWYKVKRTVNGQTKYGAEDRYGNMIFPTEYDHIYTPLETTGFEVEKGKFRAWYSKSGKCVIPYSRGYTWIKKWDNDEFGTYYTYEKPDGGGICDRNGREVVSVKADGLSFIQIYSTTINEKEQYFLSFNVKKNGEKYCGIADANGRIIVPAEYKEYETALDLATSRLTTTNNPLAGNRHKTLAEAEGRSSGGSNSYSSSSSASSSSSSSSSNSNSGNKTTTVVVEHHRDPVPVQEWVQCTACWGSGTCPDCAGSGTKYVGSSLKRCWRCGGRGGCSSCSGQGGRYYTVYK